jgi:hypothetical protein
MLRHQPASDSRNHHQICNVLVICTVISSCRTPRGSTAAMTRTMIPCSYHYYQRRDDTVRSIALLRRHPYPLAVFAQLTTHLDSGIASCLFTHYGVLHRVAE